MRGVIEPVDGSADAITIVEGVEVDVGLEALDSSLSLSPS